MADKRTQMAVIGAGPGGYAAAFLAADLGMDVTLIDPEENPGGVCLYRGCIPSKALLHAAKLLFDAREADAWGLTFSGLKIRPDKLRNWKNETVVKLTGGLGELVKQRQINHIRGMATFQDHKTLNVEEVAGKQSTLAFENAVVATGSIAAVIPKLALDSDRMLDSTSALNLEDIPQKLLVIGGGYIGLELGTAYAALGDRKSVV